jgi:hypothetical protein
MVRNCRNIARAAALSALLLLVLPAGANAAPTGLLDQVLQTTSTTVAQVQETVSRTVDPARAAPTPAPAPDVVRQVPEQVAKPAVETVQSATPELPAPSVESGAPPAPEPAVRKAPERRRHAAPARAGEPRAASSRAAPPSTPSSGPAVAAEHSAAQAAPPVADTGRAVSERSSGARPDGPSFGAAAGGSAVSAAFSAGALAILLGSLFLGASALRTRLPRLGEAGRPLPLVFALERPG